MSRSLRLPNFFSDYMVLQRDARVRIWGWAEADAPVRVEFGGRVGQTIAGADGRWRVSLEPLSASAEPREVRISSGGEQIVFRDVLVGDVWLCSGQSNMEMTLEQTGQAAAPANANLRMLRVAQAAAAEPLADVTGTWQTCTAETAGMFSAVGYWFGEHLQRDIGVPVGLINASWGGTEAEAWMTWEAVNADPAFAKIVARCNGKPVPNAATEPHRDRGNVGLERGFADPGHGEAANWPTMEVPQYWENAGLNIDGAVADRRFDLPAVMG